MTPLLEYASPVGDPNTISCIDSIEKVQRLAARWYMQDYKPTSSVTAMFEELDLPSLQSRRKKARRARACVRVRACVHMCVCVSGCVVSARRL